MDDLGKCTSCRNNEDDLKRAQRETMKIKKENDELRDSLKEMSKMLDQTLINKQKAQQAHKPMVVQESRQEVLEEQIKNTNKQIESYKKTLRYYKKKQQGDYSLSRVAELQQTLIDKRKQLRDLKSENKGLDISKRNTEKKLVNDNPERQLSLARDEVMALTVKVANMKKQKEHNEKNYDQQEKHIEEVLTKQEEICDKLGIENKVLERPTEEIFNKKDDDGYYDSDDDQKDKKVKMKYEEFQKLENHIRILQESIAQNDKKHKYQIDKLEAQIKSIESSKIDLKDTLADRKKNLEATQAKLKEIQDSMKQSSYIDMGMFIKKEQTIRRLQAGMTVSSDNARAYKDIEDLAFPDDMYITEVSITSYQNYIIGLEAVYRNRKGLEKQRIKCFQPSKEIEGSVTQTMKLTSIEHIAQVTGYYSVHIEYLKLMTTRGQYIFGGSDKAYMHCSKFNLEIKKDEKPTSFFGIVDFIQKKKRRGKEAQEAQQALDGEYVLINMGVECRKKEAPSARMDAIKIQQLQQQQEQQQPDEDYDESEQEQYNETQQQSAVQQQEQEDQEEDTPNDKNSELDQQDESVSQKGEEQGDNSDSERNVDEDENDKVVL